MAESERIVSIAIGSGSGRTCLCEDNKTIVCSSQTDSKILIIGLWERLLLIDFSPGPVKHMKVKGGIAVRICSNWCSLKPKWGLLQRISGVGYQ